MSFYDIIKNYSWEETRDSIYNKTTEEVKAALSKPVKDLEDFKALISPAAIPFLEPLAQESRRVTQKRFGKTMQLYIPLYLSNECTNFCAYCGFNHDNQINRMTLSDEEIMNEIKVIKQMGYQHLLLVTGEHPTRCGFRYLKRVMELIHKEFAQLSIEVQPMNQEEYEELTQFGLNSVYVYQETYNEANYPIYHPKGKKANYRYRLETPDRIGAAGVHKIGLGVLLGLEDWRTDSFFTALHLNYLEKTYWKSKYSLSFPRLRPHVGHFQPNSVINDRDLLQLICAYRVFNEEIEISLSTREQPKYRDHMVQLGVTTMSAGSKTEPGGYARENEALEQFVIGDGRSPEEIVEMIHKQGYETVWKDWDTFMQLP